MTNVPISGVVMDMGSADGVSTFMCLFDGTVSHVYIDRWGHDRARESNDSRQLAHAVDTARHYE
jgi:hypothetical protein